MAAAPYMLVHQHVATGVSFERAQGEAREYLVGHPQLEVDALGELILEAEWLANTRAVAARADQSLVVELPPRMIARTQAKLDDLLAAAYQARLESDPAWRYGVQQRDSPEENRILHAFALPSIAAVAIAMVFLLISGIQLERAWGSLAFGVFAISAIPLSAEIYRLLDASSGIPWSGAAGLIGALLGAHLIHGLGGKTKVPGWLLLPAWLALEVFVVREARFGDSTIVPWTTLCASVGVGALFAGALRFMGFEERIARAAAKRLPRGPNPIVQRAARLRSDGDPYQAFDLMQAAWRDEPGDEELGEAFFSIAVEVGQPEAAAEAILPQLRAALKRGDVERAVELWYPLASNECDVTLEATASVRLGEALLDAGHPDQALFSLSSALDAGVSPAHATRIVSIARDLDEGLTRRAAAIALHEVALDPDVRADLEALVATQESESAAPGEPAAVPETSLDRRVHAEHQTVETTAFPLDLDSDLESDLDDESSQALDFDLQRDLAGSDDPEGALAQQALDPSALSADRLNEGADPIPEEMSVGSPDVLSHWGPADDATDPLTDVSDALDREAREEALLEPEDLETPDLGFDFGLRSYGADLVDPLDDETDSDLTPMMDATDELTSPMQKAAADRDAHEEDPATVIFDQAAAHVPATTVPPESTPAPAATDAVPATRILPDDVPAHPPRQAVSAPSVEAPSPPVADDEFAIGSTEPDAATAIFEPRVLKAVEAVPLEATDQAIEIDADDRGKSKLPYSRIQAISIAAVQDLGPRPVLVVDLLLNWTGDASEPLKSIRFRSDRFDPCAYVPSADNPLEALTTWIADLERRSGATCLPTRRVLEGSFTRFESLAVYEREVLLANSQG